MIMSTELPRNIVHFIKCKWILKSNIHFYIRVIRYDLAKRWLLPVRFNCRYLGDA